MWKVTLNGLLIVSALPLLALAQEDPLSAYRSVLSVPPLSSPAPVVAEVSLPGTVGRSGEVLVYEVEGQTFIGSYVRQVRRDEKVAVTTVTDPATPNSQSLTDGDLDTAVRFEVPADYRGEVKVVITTDRPVTASALNLQLAPLVSLPTSVEITAQTASGQRTVLSPSAMQSTMVTFPEVTADRWEVTLTYVQPLVIKELSLQAENAFVWTDSFVRFLMQPGKEYEIYLDPDRKVLVSTTEAGNLGTEDTVWPLAALPLKENRRFVPGDVDEDGVPDEVDNCVSVSNTDQIDINSNGLGDACDDFDVDGIPNDRDNCINEPNRAQTDEDGDGIGDVCDQEESRFTEQHAWVPWVGMGTASLVLLILFIVVARSERKNEV